MSRWSNSGFMTDAIQRLTAEVAAGNSAAVEAFYREYFEWLYVRARRATGRDESFCLDVVQEAVLRIMRSIRAVESRKQLEAWLTLVVRTTAYDLLRSEARRVKREVAFAVVGPRETADDAEDSDEQTMAWLKREIEKLDARIVRIIDLRYHQQWTLARIGELFGVSAGTIDGRLRRALKQLRRQSIAEIGDE